MIFLHKFILKKEFLFFLNIIKIENQIYINEKIKEILINFFFKKMNESGVINSFLNLYNLLVGL